VALRERLFKTGVALHVRVFRLSGGRVGCHIGKAPVLLLTHEGRRTGKVRTNPLVYLADGDRLVIVASYGGAPQHPSWYHNLVANPGVEVQIGKTRRPMTARTATPEERAAFWPQVVAMYGGYDSYQRKTEREIPLVVLEQRSSPKRAP
jgi:deazaflavin-dependent oxidoreductase (nitroreductase family)